MVSGTTLTIQLDRRYSR